MNNKDELNLLFLQDAPFLLESITPTYLVYPLENEHWVVEEVPLIYKGNISEVRNRLCYDFDELDQNYQNLFQLLKMRLIDTNKRVEEHGKINPRKRIFKQETKIYEKRKTSKQ